MDSFTFFNSGSGSQISSTLANTASLLRFYINGIPTSGGAYVSIQSQSPQGDWFDLINQRFTGFTGIPIQQITTGINGPAFQLRAQISGYVDGQYSASVQGLSNVQN